VRLDDHIPFAVPVETAAVGLPEQVVGRLRRQARPVLQIEECIARVRPSHPARKYRAASGGGKLP
jgi:hypothetical protein